MKNKIKFLVLFFMIMLGFSARQLCFAKNVAPKMSVIIPVYKVEKYIKECLDSVVNQTLRDIEIICIDDGSPDKSGEILDEYAKKDERIIVVHQENTGTPGARQVGIDMARGEYIKPMDGDDILDLKACEICYKKAKKDNADILIHGAYKFKTKGKSEILRKLNDCTITDQRFDLIVNTTCMNCYKTDFIRKNNINYSGIKKKGEDQSFNMICLPKAQKIKTISDILYYYRLDNNQSVTRTVREKKCAQYLINNINIVKKDWHENGFFKNPKAKNSFLKWAVSYYYFKNCLDYEMNREFLNACGKELLEKKVINSLPKKQKQKLNKIMYTVKRCDAATKNNTK